MGPRVRGDDTPTRHCERSEAIQSSAKQVWIASSLSLLAMTGQREGPTHPALADLPPWQIKSAPLGCGKSTRRANHF